MSAVNAFAAPGVTFLFSDAAILHGETLSLVAVGSKVAVFPQYQAAISATGQTLALGYLSTALAQRDFANFAHLIASIPDVLRGLIKHYPAQLDNFRFAVAGPGSLFCIQAEEGIGTKPLEMTECPKFITPAAVDLDDQSIVNMRFDADQPAKSGLAIMNAQRQKFRGLIGGWCQMTTVTPKAITQQMIERWPDKVGQPINPISD